MEDIFKPIECNDDDVVEIKDNIYKISKIKSGVSQSSNENLSYSLEQELGEKSVDFPSCNYFSDEGIDCKILTLGSQNWKKGKIKFKLSIEFYIEEDVEINNSQDLDVAEVESSLDELRRKLQEES
ncbi:KGK family protein [Nostoc sp. FACHB-87]|uniref:KGK domain-containing protein n=1 Tax=Nostocaceae TaxID=1162 RepID=UPI0016860E51|nr:MULTISPECIES: KGK domain-containing protein [Nostocaceae]MBD2458918.1 KGK family protein [Nostoc sp. FACHB-87]MBD2479950.1 KGK family protein [Anabaena sp. FACHB-83]